MINSRPRVRADENYGSIYAVRGIAACLVIVFHTMHVRDRRDFPAGGIWHFFDYGWLGVNLFLVISGLVITLSMFRHMERSPQGYRWAFFVSRLARIVPLYLLTGAVFLAVVVPAWLHGSPAELFKHLGSHLAFVHNLHHDTHGSINGPNWSIALEMQFYLLMVLIAPWLALRPRAVHLAGALAVALAYRCAAAVAVPAGDITTQFIYATQLPGVIDHFALGVALAVALDPTHRSAWLQPGWRAFFVASAVSVLLLGLVASLFLNFGYWENNAMVTFAPGLAAAGFTALLAAAITFPLAHHVSLRPLNYLGEISYGLYLWHLPILLLLMAAAPQLKGIALLATVLGITVVCSSLSWHLVERPLNRFFRRRGAGNDRRGSAQLASTQFP